MRYIVKREEMQAIDAYSIETLGIPSMVLMERAAMAVAQVLEEYMEELELAGPAQVLIVTEGGNNGGDGLAVARMLHEWGCRVDVVQIGGVKKETEQYQQQKKILSQLGIPVVCGVTDKVMQAWRTPRYDVIVDAVFGVGLKREVQSPQREVLELLNELGGLKCAVDIPSGIDSTDGRVLGCAFRADVTVTFGCEKTGQRIGAGPEYCGDILVADIGFPRQAVENTRPECYCYEEEDIRRLPVRSSTGNKGTFGKVTIVAGSESVCGAAVLSAESAYRTGCGLVEVVTHINNREAVQKAIPEALLHVYSNQSEAEALLQKSLQWADVMVIGPGIGIGDTGTAMVRQAIASDCPLIVDADAITILAGHEDWWQLRTEKVQDSKNLHMILTPHMKEMERISRIPIEQLKLAPWDCARELSHRGAVCVLKDARTVVTEPEREYCYINLSGNDGMATGGSGDVLTGVIAGLLAQGLDAGEAARMGVYLHGLAGDTAAMKCGHYSMLASDIIAGLVDVLGSSEC
jgi:NAD(P)H-hydrate epimerase